MRRWLRKRVVCTDLIFTGGFARLRLVSWKTTVRDDPAPLFAPCPSLALLYFNSARLGLSRVIESTQVQTDIVCECRCRFVCKLFTRLEGVRAWNNLIKYALGDPTRSSPVCIVPSNNTNWYFYHNFVSTRNASECRSVLQTDYASQKAYHIFDLVIRTR